LSGYRESAYNQGVFQISSFLPLSIATFAIWCAVAPGLARAKSRSDATPAVLRISSQEYREKVHASWLGQIVGNIYGLSYEFLFIDQPGPDDFPYGFGNSLSRVREVNGAFSDDDTDIEYMYLLQMERHGIEPTYEQLANAWKYHVRDRVWVANRSALTLMHAGYSPPATGSKDFNPNWFQIDPQLVNEIWAVTAPGMLDYATRKSAWAARITNDDFGIEPTIHYAAMYAAAFFESDIERLIDIGTTALPPGSRFAGTVEHMKRLFRQYPDDWRKAREAMADSYYGEFDYNRHASTERPLKEPGDRKFREDLEVPFPTDGSNLSFVNVTPPLLHAGVQRAALGKEPDALTWTRRLLHRWQQARHPETKLCGGQLSYRKHDRAQDALGHVHPRINEARIVASYHQTCRYHHLPLAQMQAAEILIEAGGDFAETGREFIRWASDDLKVYSRHCYDPESGKLIAMMTDGTPLRWRESRTGYYVPESFSPRALDSTLLWGYALAYRLMIYLTDELQEPRHPLPVQRALDHLYQRLDRTVSLAELSRAAAVSVPHICWLFRRHLGTPPLTFFRRLKLQQARVLLRGTTARIEEIALRLGYKDSTHFSHLFSRETGLSPREYRKRQRS